MPCHTIKIKIKWQREGVVVYMFMHDQLSVVDDAKMLFYNSSTRSICAKLCTTELQKMITTASFFDILLVAVVLFQLVLSQHFEIFSIFPNLGVRGGLY